MGDLVVITVITTFVLTFLPWLVMTIRTSRPIDRRDRQGRKLDVWHKRLR